MAAKKRAKRSSSRSKPSRRGTAKRSVRPKAKAPRKASGARRAVVKSAPRKVPRATAPKPASAPPPAAMQGPNAIGCASQHMDYTSHAMDEVKHFYTDVLGFSNFQHDPNANYLFVVTGPSSSLGFMPPMPGPPEQWRPPREPVIYLMVRDVNRAHTDLVAKGQTFQQPPTDMPWGHRVATLRDPEGRAVCLAQALAR